MQTKEDLCVVKNVTCSRRGQVPNIEEKCYLSCEGREKEIRVIVKGPDTKAVQPGQMYKVKVSTPDWEGIVPD